MSRLLSFQKIGQHRSNARVFLDCAVLATRGRVPPPAAAANLLQNYLSKNWIQNPLTLIY